MAYLRRCQRPNRDVMARLWLGRDKKSFIPEHSMCEDLLDAHTGNLAVVETPK
jgi:hypothetical protein